MPVLELFSGSKTVSNFFISKGIPSISVDINSKLSPSICCDILKLSRDMLPGSVDFIWASPDCTCFSRAGLASHWIKLNIGYRRYRYTPVTPEAQTAFALLLKTIEIINWFPDVQFVIENPVGRMRHFSELAALAPYRYSVNYKDWAFSYSKETDLFTNILLPFSSSVPLRPGLGLRSVNSKYSRSMVPVSLIDFISKYIHYEI